MPVLISLTILLIVWIKYESSKTERLSQKSSDSFWKREQDAQHTRNQSLDSISFFQIEPTSFPLCETPDLELEELQATLSQLANKDMANLSSYTNTELKLTFGIARFQYLSDCDANFFSLMKTLDSLGDYYIRHNKPDTAKIFLEYAVSHETELRHTYEQLETLTVA